MFSGVSAKCNDYLMRAQKEEVGETGLAKLTDCSFGVRFRELCQKEIARANAVTVFPALATLDLVIGLVHLSFKGIKFIFSFDKQKRASQLNLAKHEFCVAKKCLRGIVASPAGLFAPDIVTRHFVPPTIYPGIIEAGGKYHRAPGTEIQLETIDDVQRLVTKAIAEGKKITISGAHYSQSKDTLPTVAVATAGKAVCINMQKLNKVIINPEKKTAMVQAGATWADVQHHANKHGLMVKVMQASNVFSIGGSLGVNCHGWNHRSGTLAETVRSITIINAQGERQVLLPTKASDRELFSLVVGGHGLFGLIIEAEIDLTPNESLVSWGKKIPIVDYTKWFKTQILPNENHRMHLFRLSLDPDNLLKEGVASTYSRVTDRCKMPGIGVANLVDEPETGTMLDRILIHVARCLPFCRRLYWKKESNKIIEEERLAGNSIMRPPIKAAFNHSRADAEWLQEYFVKGKDLPEFLEKLGAILTANKVTLLNASVRFVKKDERSQLAYAKGEDHFAVVLFFNQSLAKEEITKTSSWVKEVINYLSAHDGTFYLPYQHFATQDQFAACYPHAVETVRLKHKYDPDGVFDNGLYHDYLKPMEGLAEER